MARGQGLYASVVQFAGVLFDSLDTIETPVLPAWNDPALGIESRFANMGLEGQYVIPPSIVMRGNAQNGISRMFIPNIQRRPPRYDRIGSQTGEYPHLKHKTVEWMAADTRTTALATNTTLATAIRHDTTSKTIFFPETQARVIESVRLVVTYRSEYAATNSITGWRLGLKVGLTGPTIDFDRKPTAQNTASRNVTDEVDSDVTEQMAQYIGSGTSVAIVCSFACATTVAASVNQITFKLVVTYAFNGYPGASDTRLRMIKIPLQSMAGPLTLVQQEFGTDGVNPVATAQIPVLNTYCAESGKTFRQVYLELWAHDGNNSGTVAFTPFIQIDALAEVARATVSTTVNAYQLWRDQYDLTGLDTSVTHTVKMRADLTNRMPCIGGFLVVIYELDHVATLSANLATYSMMCPFTDSLSDMRGHMSTGQLDQPDTGGAAGVLVMQDRLAANLEVQEPGTITLLQSGAFIMWTLSGAGGNFNIGIKLAQQVAARIYLHTAATSGPTPLVMRAESAWSIARGLNRYTLETSGGRPIRYAYALINYTAGIRSDIDNGNHMVNYAIKSYGESTTELTSAVYQDAQSQRPPVLGTPYRIVTAMIEAHLRATIVLVDQFVIQQRDGELDNGWTKTGDNDQGGAGVYQSNRHMFVLTRSVNRDTLSTGKIDVTIRRTMIPLATSNSGSYIGFAAMSWWIGYHQHAFTVAGTITIDGLAVGAGKVVKIYAYDQVPVGLYRDGLTNLRDTAELITSVLTDAAGGYTATVPGNTRSYFASYDNDGKAGRSLLGTPV